METNKVLRIGSQVQITNVDDNGFQGREFQPTKLDVGKIGFITGIIEHGSDVWVNVFDDITNPFKTSQTIHDDEYVMYEMKTPAGDVFQVLSYELQVLKAT